MFDNAEQRKSSVLVWRERGNDTLRIPERVPSFRPFRMWFYSALLSSYTADHFTFLCNGHIRNTGAADGDKL